MPPAVPGGARLRGWRRGGCRGSKAGWSCLFTRGTRQNGLSGLALAERGWLPRATWRRLRACRCDAPGPSRASRGCRPRCCLAEPLSGQTLPRLKVSENRRFLVTADGQPFFWLGDTAWELFHRSDSRRGRALPARSRRATLHRHPGRRARRARRPGTPNAYGQLPLVDNDPTRRRTRRYFAHVDWIVRQGQQPGPVRGPAADLGRQVEQEVGRRTGDLHAGRTPRPTALARRALQGRGRDLDPRRRPPDRNGGAPRDHRGHGPRPARRRWRVAPDHLSSRRRAGLAPSTSTTPTGSTSTCGRTATRRSTRAATTRRASTTTARRSSPCSTASRSTKTIRSRSTPSSSGTRSPATCAARCTGTSSTARSATPTGITRSGRCGRRIGSPSTIR